MFRLSREVTVRGEWGLHARPAARIVQTAQHAKSDIWLIKEGKVADGKSVIDILLLGCGSGKRITIKAENFSDLHILDAIAGVIEGECGEAAA